MMDSPVWLDGHSLTLEEWEQVVFHRRPVQLAPTAITAMERSRRLVDGAVARGDVIYGITTGFGKFSDTVIDREQSEELQHNLIKSHACGVGEPLSEEIVRGMMVLRANALARGYSGIRPSTVNALILLLNDGIHPVIPSQGSLGASGDLAPLAHMILPLIGEGEVSYRGQRMGARTVLDQRGHAPITLAAKEGLALINGTQMMASICALAIRKAENLLISADIISAMTMEALGGIPDALHPLLHQARGQMGQLQVAAHMRALLHGSHCLTRPGEKRVQDAYSLRCIPQVHGASRDAYEHVEAIVIRELNAVTDNPLLFTDENLILSGGNFHGQPLALAADYLGIAMAEIANISERRSERLLNPQLSGLPPFLTQKGGLHSGYMILQYVAAALVSENKGLAHPASVDSIPSSANQEDHVSMGSIAARKLLRILDNVTRVLAIEWITAAQGLEFSDRQMGAGTVPAYRLIRKHIPPLVNDRPGQPDIEQAAQLIESGQLVKAAAVS
ncbi:histidine ammonia-lyase [Desmospora activa]|uniref:Histidine ammonia-lyase n=1 Tax=Desmospora activa DSM 45169 TaxID=1121389 RepID=A0A2T4Z9C3_9BACL|nr:histidine ammonia-lyase [Desmospora activa]PTM58501.1 histidine ammonia-lyase [Desmospora activa DSM 45169]